MDKTSLPKGITLEGFTPEGNLILTNAMTAWPDVVSHGDGKFKALAEDANDTTRIYVRMRDLPSMPSERKAERRALKGGLPKGTYTMGTDSVGNLVLGMQAGEDVDWPESFELEGVKYVGIPCSPNTMRVYAIAENIAKVEPEAHSYDFHKNHHTSPTARLIALSPRERILALTKAPGYDVRNIKVTISANGIDMSPDDLDDWIETEVRGRVARLMRHKGLHSIESAARRRVIEGVRGHFDSIETSIAELMQVMDMHRESLDGIGRMFWDHKEQSELASIGCFSVVMPKALESYMEEPSQQWRHNAMLFFIDLVRNTYQNVDEYGREKFERLASNIRAQLEANECELFDSWYGVAKQGHQINVAELVELLEARWLEEVRPAIDQLATEPDPQGQKTRKIQAITRTCRTAAITEYLEGKGITCKKEEAE